MSEAAETPNEEEILQPQIAAHILRDIEMHPTLRRNPNALAILQILGANDEVFVEVKTLYQKLGITYDEIRYLIRYLQELFNSYPQDFASRLETQEVNEKTCQLSQVVPGLRSIEDCEKSLLAGKNLRRKDLFLALLFLAKNIGVWQTTHQISDGMPVEKSGTNLNRCLHAFEVLMERRSEYTPFILEVNKDVRPYEYCLSPNPETTEACTEVNPNQIVDYLAVLAIVNDELAQIFAYLQKHLGQTMDTDRMAEEFGITTDELTKRLGTIWKFLKKHSLTLNYKLNRDANIGNSVRIIGNEAFDEAEAMPIPYVNRQRASGTTPITEEIRDSIRSNCSIPTEVNFVDGLPKNWRHLLANSSMILFEESGQTVIPQTLAEHTEIGVAVSTEHIRRRLMKELDCDNLEATIILGQTEEKFHRNALVLGFGLVVSNGYAAMQFFNHKDRLAHLRDEHKIYTPWAVNHSWFFDPSLGFSIHTANDRIRIARRTDLFTEEEARITTAVARSHAAGSHPSCEKLTTMCGFNSTGPIHRILESIFDKRFRTGVYPRVRTSGTECVNLCARACKKRLTDGQF